MVEAGFEHLANLRAGFDGAWLCFHNFEVVGAKVEGLAHVFVSTAAVGLPNFSALELFTSRAFAAREPGAVAAMQQVLSRAVRTLQSRSRTGAGDLAQAVGRGGDAAAARHPGRYAAALRGPGAGRSGPLARAVRHLLGHGLRRHRASGVRGAVRLSGRARRSAAAVDVVSCRPAGCGKQPARVPRLGRGPCRREWPRGRWAPAAGLSPGLAAGRESGGRPRGRPRSHGVRCPRRRAPPPPAARRGRAAHPPPAGAGPGSGRPAPALPR